MAELGFEPSSEGKAPFCSAITDPESELENGRPCSRDAHLLMSSSLTLKVHPEYFGFFPSADILRWIWKIPMSLQVTLAYFP